MVREIIQIGDDILTQTSEPIELGEISSGVVQDLANDLIDTTKFHDKAAAGLSAVQLGVLKRIFVVKLNDNEAPRYEVLINPEIIEKSDTISMLWEGCMSISDGKKRLFGPVDRPKSIKVKYYNLKGEQKTIDGINFFSHLLQHEMDHLNGVLFLSYIANPKNIWNEEELDKYLDINGTFPPKI